jgi:hypothetical protein
MVRQSASVLFINQRDDSAMLLAGDHSPSHQPVSPWGVAAAHYVLIFELLRCCCGHALHGNFYEVKSAIFICTIKSCSFVISVSRVSARTVQILGHVHQWNRSVSNCIIFS